MVPFVFVLAILGLQRLNLRRTPLQSNPATEWSGRQADPGGRSNDRLPLAAAILVISLAMNTTYGWVGSKRSGEFERANQHERILAGFTAQIPRQATISALAEREAAKDRKKLMGDQGEDANHSQEKIVEIRRTVSAD